MKLSPRLNRIVLLGRCFWRAIFHGVANKVFTDSAGQVKISKVIVVPTGKLGDVVCATPVLRVLREKLPAAQIVVASNTKISKSILMHSGLVDEYFDLEAPDVVRRARALKADAAFVTGPSYLSTAIFCAANVPLVVAASVVGGFSPSETRLFKVLKKLIKTFPYHIEAYAPRERLRVLESIGVVSEDTKKHLGFSTEADQKVKQFLIDNGISVGKDFVVGVSPTAGNKIKEWPEDRFAKVVEHVTAKHGAKVLLIGGPNDEAAINKTIKYVGSGVKVLKVTDFDVDMLKALISKLSLFISVDTGPIYIAEAFGVPTIDIVGPVDERVQPPRGRIHRNVLPPGRVRAELTILNARSYDEKEAMRQVLSTSVDAVLKEIDGLVYDLKTMITLQP